MIFANPQLLWLLLVIPPAMTVFFWWSARKRQQLMMQFIQARLLPGLTVGISRSRQQIRLGCLLLAVAALLLALARPQWGFDWEEVKLRGLDIVVAIDTSKSMLAEDIPPNRLARAKLAALDLMKQARADRLGLVAFAGSAFLQCPLTIDNAAFRQSVEMLDVNVIPQGGTALADAIESALQAFKEGDNHKILVLFTDGEDHDSGALDAAKTAAESGLRIFTIGIGSVEGELLGMKDAKGRTEYIRDEQGNVVKSHLNETLLQQIAGAANGVYFPLRGAKTMDTLYKDWLAPLPKTESQQKFVRRYHEHFHWPLSAAMLLLLVEIFFPERKREARTRAAVLAKPAAQASAILLLFLLPVTIQASPASALREYNAGKFDRALKEYEQLLQRKSDDPSLNFNAGAAAYRNQQFDDAARRFDRALTSPDLKLQERAYYNRGNTLYHLGEANSDPSKRSETWKKSLEDFQSTLKLNPQDADAKFNYEFIKKRLEELKKQQQQQQNKSDQQKHKDQDQQQQQNKQNDQSKKDQDQQKQSQQNQSEQKQDSSQNQQGQQQKQEEKDKEQQQANQSKEQKDKQQQQANQSAAQPKEKSEEKETADQSYAAGQMTPEQAQQLLDAQKGEEMMLPAQPPAKLADRSRPIRDW